MVSTKILLALALVQPALGFVGVSVVQQRVRSLSTESSTLLRDSEEDSVHAATPLTLSASDLERLSALKARHKTVPLLIMDAMVPGQTMSFESADPKFHNLVQYVLEEETEIGMVGLNPHTGRPLNVGVTLPVSPENVLLDAKTNVLTLNVQAKQRLEVQGEPWLHHNDDDEETEPAKGPRDASFYMADVEIIDERPEERLSDDMAAQTQNLANQIPLLIGTWVHHLVVKQRVDALKMESRMVELGPLPAGWRDQALWVAALLNPTSSHHAAGEEKVCLEIRPAMLSCRNDHERMVLATAALEASIDHVSGKKKLF